MTAVTAEREETPPLPLLPLDAGGCTDVDLSAHLAGLRRTKDMAEAAELLALAELVEHLTAHPAPDQDAIATDQVAIRHHHLTWATGRPLTAHRTAVELVGLHFSRAHGMDLLAAVRHVEYAHDAGTTHRRLWGAVADGSITWRQATTIARQAASPAAPAPSSWTPTGRSRSSKDPSCSTGTP